MFIRMFAAAACALPVAVCNGAGLTLDGAAAVALVNQPLLASQQATVDATRQNAVAEAQLPDPRLKLGISNVPTTDFSIGTDFMTQRTVAIEQMFPAAVKRKLRGERGELEAAVAEAELENLKRTLRRDVRLAWLNVFQPLRAAQLVDGARRFFEQQREAALISQRAGRGSAAAVTKAQLEIELQQDRRLDLAGQAARARAELARWIGAAADGEIADSLPAMPAAAVLAAARDRIDQHPQLLGAHREIELAENDVAQARAAYKSDWSLELAYSRRGPAFSDMVGVQVGIDLPVFAGNRQDRRLASRLAAKSKHENQHADHRRMLLAEFEAAYASFESASQRNERFVREILPQATQRSALAMASYQSGGGELAGVLEARQAELDLQLQQLAIATEQARALVRLQYLTE